MYSDRKRDDLSKASIAGGGEDAVQLVQPKVPTGVQGGADVRVCVSDACDTSTTADVTGLRVAAASSIAIGDNNGASESDSDGDGGGDGDIAEMSDVVDVVDVAVRVGVGTDGFHGTGDTTGGTGTDGI
jgi:hypothetical protein